jgi:hypothetical protein
MIKLENIKFEIEVLIQEGEKFYNCFADYSSSRNVNDIKYFLNNYEKWYTKAYILVMQIIPQRLDDFVRRYRNDKRKSISLETYTISDALQLVENTKCQIHYAAMPILQQVEIVKSCSASYESEIYNMQTLLQADIFDSEIESAKHLLKRGFLRAAGAICGVVLEKHFSEICDNHKIEVKKKSPTIADYNDILKDNVYDTIEWRRTQRLGDLRNLCDHNKDREPTKEEVDELISGTERVIKTIF